MYEIQTIDKNEMKIPPKWIIKDYLSLQPPRKFHVSDLKSSFEDSNTLHQFLNEAHKFNLVTRLERGKYFAPSLHTAIDSWAMDDYHSKLILLNSLFDYLDLPHAFLCISTNLYADYIPDRVMPVLKKEQKNSSRNT